MTSALITDIPAYNNAGLAPAKGRSQEDSQDFISLMSQAADADKSGTDILSDHLARPKSETKSTDSIDLVNTKPQRFDAKDRVTAQDAKKPVDKETADKVNEAVSTYGTKVRENIKDNMDVTDEQITEAMEALGFTYVDLLNPDNLKMLLSEIAGEDQLVSLLTDSGFPNLLSTIEDLGRELIDSLDMSTVELKGIELDLMISGELDEGGIELPAIMVLPEDENADNVFTTEPVIAETGEEISTGTTGIISEDDTDQTATLANMGADDQPMTEDVLAAAPAVDTNTAAQTQTVKADTEYVDESNDLSDAPEEGFENLVQNTGDSKEAAADNGQQNAAADEMLNRSREGMARSAEASLASAENTVSTQTFTQVVNTVSGEQTIQLVQSYTSVNTQEVISQIVTQARTTISDTVSQMEMMLNPENLGRMILQVTQQEGAVTARFIAQSEGVREALAMQMELLRENLDQAGIKVNAIEVSTGTHEFERNLEEGMAESNENTDNKPNEGENRQGRRDINLNDPDELMGVMSEEEALVASMMRDQGNTMNVTA